MQTNLGGLRTVAIATIAVTSLVCVCGGLVTAAANDGEVGSWPLAVGGIAALLLLGWGVVGIVRGWLRAWRLFRHGELIWATVEERIALYDGDGDHRWEMRVSGHTRTGKQFRRTVRAGYTEPPPVGSQVEVRYLVATGALEHVERGPSAVAILVVSETVLLLLLAGLLYTIGAILWAYANALA